MFKAGDKVYLTNSEVTLTTASTGIFYWSGMRARLTGIVKTPKSNTSVVMVQGFNGQYPMECRNADLALMPEG